MLDNLVYEKKLKEYINKNLKKGFSIEDIKKKLRENNVNQKTIEKLTSKNKKTPFFLIILIFFTIIITIFLFSKYYFSVYYNNPNYILDNVVRIQDLSSCNLEEDYSKKVSCYIKLNKDNPNVYVCAFFFVNYESNISYDKKMEFGELILKIDDELAYNPDWRNKSDFNELFFNFLSKKKIGNLAKIETDKDTYYYKYLNFEDGNVEYDYEGAYIFIQMFPAFCNK